MNARTQEVIPAANMVVHTYDAAWAEGGKVTLEMTRSRTSQGNDTHIAMTSAVDNHRSLRTFCGLDNSGRVHHSVWSIEPGKITCEKCNGAKGGKPARREFWNKLAAIFAAS